MNGWGASAIGILTAITGVALVAVIISRNSDTANVIKAAGSAYAEALKIAVSPVMGGNG